MKTTHIFYLFAILFTAVSLNAQQGINYKAIIYDDSGDPLANTSITVQFAIIENGTINVYQETHYPNTDDKGIIIVNIGEGTIISGDFNTIDWGSNTHFLNTKIDTGEGPTDMGTVEFKAVPYALYAEYATTAHNVTEVKTLSQVLSSGNDAGDNRIVNLSDPIELQDAVTKNYIDKKLRALGLIPHNFAGILSDIEENEYATITIGSQTWMAENLRATKLNDGTDIQIVADNPEWVSLTNPAYCWYENSADLGNFYGALYNQLTIRTGKLCPSGWHVPLGYELEELVSFLGGEEVAGGKLKEIGLIHWVSQNVGATNTTEFTAIPGGFRYHDGSFSSFGSGGYFWLGSYNPNYWSVLSNSDDIFMNSLSSFNFGMSVRCLKD